MRASKYSLNVAETTDDKNVVPCDGVARFREWLWSRVGDGAATVTAVDFGTSRASTGFEDVLKSAVLLRRLSLTNCKLCSPSSSSSRLKPTYPTNNNVLKPQLI